MPKSRKRQTKKAKPDQHAQFVETARRLGADIDEETFRAAIGRIASTQPSKAEEHPYVLDCHIDLNADIETAIPVKQDGFDKLEDAISRAEVVWKARAKNGFKKLVVYSDVGDGWVIAQTWPPDAPV